MASAGTNTVGGPQYYPYRSQILKDDVDGTYNKYVTKRDIVWIEDTIHIAEPLISNGGDVFLFARTLIIDAPIDTRVSVPTYGPYWLWGYVPPEIVQAHTSSDFPIAINGPLPSELKVPWKIFLDVRFWEDRFDPAAQMYRFQGKPTYEEATIPLYKSGVPGPFDPHIPRFPISNYQLPSGKNAAVPDHAGGHEANGTDAPDIADRDAVRSGDVYVFAKTLAVDSHYASIAWTKSPVGDDFDFDRPILFQTGGLKGGRGGDGSITSWNADTRPNGLSGKPGRGGDAGSVFFYLIDDGSGRSRAESTAIGSVLETQRRIISGQTSANSFNDAHLTQTLAWACNVSGGYPPYWGRRLRTVPSSAIPRAANRNSLFTSETANDGPLSSAIGDPGAISFQDVSFSRALELLAQGLGTLDLRMPSKLALQLEAGTQFADTSGEAHASSLADAEDQHRRDQLLAQMLRLRSSTTRSERVQLSAREQLVGFLETELVKAELRFITAALGEQEDSSGLIVDEISFDKLRSAAFTDVEREFLSVWAPFKRAPNLSVIQSYFLNVGGIYAQPSSETINGHNYLANENALLQSLNVRLSDLIDKTIPARQESVVSWKRYFDENYLGQIADLKRQIAAIASANQDALSLSRQLADAFTGVQKAAGERWSRNFGHGYKWISVRA